MRLRKAGVNFSVNILTYIIAFLPSFIIRKVFLDSLGNELLGLNSLYSNIIGLMSIIELGIGSAIIFSLYKPFAEKNYIKVRGYLNYYEKFYKIVGSIIFIVGIMIIPFLNLFIKGAVNIREAKIYFILFLLNTVISYFFTYKLCLLNVSQEGYIVSIATTISKVVIAILQVLFLKIYNSFYLFLIIQLVVNLIYYIFINKYIDKKFKTIIKLDGEIEKNEKDALVRNIKALFLHKIASLIVFGTDNMIISYFINLSTVSKYNSYNMIINSLQGFLGNGLSGITSSIGNLLAEDKSEYAYEVHKKLFFINFWMVSFVIISLFNTIDQFIVLWLGKGQLIDRFTVCIILVNSYFYLMRSSVDKFKEAGGIYHQDRFAPLFEAGINLVASLILVNRLGLVGVFLGTLISNLLVVFWVKPKVVYKYVFKKPLKQYFIMYFKYIIYMVPPFIISNLLTRSISTTNTILAFLYNCIINVIVINSVYICIFFRKSEFKYFKGILFDVVRKYIKKEKIITEQ